MSLSQASNAIVAYEGCLTAVVKAILNQVLSSGTQENYANHNSDLILWIYENYEWREALVRYFMDECLITDKAEVKKAIRATCKDALKAINRNDDNCPILLEKMTFNLFYHYIPIKKKELRSVSICHQLWRYP